jgi:ATP-dependent DNA helicase DinG
VPSGVRSGSWPTFVARPRACSSGSVPTWAPLVAADWTGERLDAYHVLDEGLEALGGLLASSAKTESLRALAARTATLRDGLSRVVEPTGAQVTWCERRPRSVAVAASPIDVGSILRERLFGSGSAVVLTSASLTSGGRFDFVRARLGLDEWTDTPVDELSVESALDYGSQALLYLPTDLPEVNDAGFVGHAVDRIERLIALTGGGAFVLCTSVRNMHAIAHALASRILVPLLVQGSAPKGELLQRFRRAEDAVLVATMSFWEGVDVPGRALRLVVIDRIPFAVPTDPLVAARCRALEEAGKPAFSAYSLPQAAITLKQGFGRLLRSRDDWGLVAVLDRRLSARGYGRALLASLPPVRTTTSLGDATDFWQARLGRAASA